MISWPVSRAVVPSSLARKPTPASSMPPPENSFASIPAVSLDAISDVAAASGIDARPARREIASLASSLGTPSWSILTNNSFRSQISSGISIALTCASCPAKPADITGWAIISWRVAASVPAVLANWPAAPERVAAAVALNAVPAAPPPSAASIGTCSARKLASSAGSVMTLPALAKKPFVSASSLCLPCMYSDFVEPTCSPASFRPCDSPGAYPGPPSIRSIAYCAGLMPSLISPPVSRSGTVAIAPPTFSRPVAIPDTKSRPVSARI